MDPLTLGAVGTAVASAGTAVATVIKSRSERAKLRAEAQDIGDAAASRAVTAMQEAWAATVEGMREHIAAQDRRIMSQEERINAQDSRILDLIRRDANTAVTVDRAVGHIAERESWTVARWPGSRPADLPAVPTSLVPAVVAVAPALRDHLPHIDPDAPHGDTRTNAERRDNVPCDNDAHDGVDTTPD